MDDGYVTGPAVIMTKIGLPSRAQNCLSPIISVGNSFQHVGALRVIDEDGMWARVLDKCHEPVLSMMGMQDCPPSTSPKLEKQSEPGDDEPCEHPELYRSSVCTILYMTRRKHDLQAAARWMCKRLSDPNQESWRQLVKKSQIHQGHARLDNFDAEFRQG